MAVSSVTASLSSVAGIEELVRLSTARQLQTVSTYKTQIDDLTVKRGIYSDVQTKLNSLRSAIRALRGSDGTTGVLNTYGASVTGDTGALTASVNSSSTAAAGTYDITVSQLASADRYASYRYSSTSTALNMSGSITLTGAADRTVSNKNVGDSQAVASFGVSSSIRTEGELSSGQYYVEVRKEGEDWQFRLVDSAGTAVSIDDATKSSTEMTDGWQDLREVAGGSFNTGRGLTISFEDYNADDYEARAKGDTGVATIQYTKAGSDVAINVEATDTLANIRDKINAVSYVDDKAVSATIVDNRLIFSTLNTGDDAALHNGGNINVALTGGSIGDGSLGFFDSTTTEYGITNRHLATAQNAKFNINGLDVIHSSNTVDDVITGVTLNLTAKTETDSSTTVTIKKDNSDVVSKIKSLLTAANDAVNHLKLKTEPQLDDSSGDTDKPVYKSAALGTDYSLRDLRHAISSDLFSTYSGATNKAFNNLMDIGIGVNEDDNYTLELSDSDVLSDALDTNFSDVSAMLNNILDRLDTRLDRYLGTKSIITRSQDGIDSQVESLTSRKDNAQERLTKMEASYRQQYYQMQATLISMQAQYQNTMSMMGSSSSLFNQQY